MINKFNEILTTEDGDENPVHVLYNRLKETKHMIGMGMLQMGALLHTFKKHDLWKGYAESWGEFCAAENISYSWGQLAIRNYETYALKLGLPDDTLLKLANCDYTALDKARKVVTQENINEWLPKLLTLGRKDIELEIKEIKGEAVFDLSAIDRVEMEFNKLQIAEQVEFRKRIG